MICKDCIHYDVCGGFTPSDLDSDVFEYCRKGISDEIPDIEGRCVDFKNKYHMVEVVRCKECKHRTTIKCPMYFEENIHYYEDDYIESDLIITDYTSDDGFCDKGEREKGGASDV